MSLWERNTFILGFGTLIAGAYYLTMVVLQSIAAGAVAAPNLLTLISYIVLQLLVSGVGMGLSVVRAKRAGELVGLDDSMDERDRLVKTRSEAGAGHLFAAAVFCALLGWFFHHSTALLFHTVLASLFVGELGRSAIQLIQYRRGV